MGPDESASYLELALGEADAARRSTSAAARQYHEELAITYEMRCLLSVPTKAGPRMPHFSGPERRSERSSRWALSRPANRIETRAKPL